jgi:predicted transcriptional regulator
VITHAISKFMHDHSFMPTKNAIAELTGLSRQTIAKHLASYTKHPEFAAELEQFKLMGPALLASVYKFGLKGNIRAARLYLEAIGTVNKQQTNTVVNEQNNYIQINNTILSQESLKQLTADQLNQIESIITNSGYKKIS